jgi:Sulfotransferase family
MYRLPPVFVVGSGRSGTTWIGGTIASCSGCIPVHEPLYRNAVAETPQWGVNSRLPGPYLRAEESHAQWAAFFDALLAGKISNAYTRQDWTKVPEFLTRWRVLERIGYRLARIQYRCRAMLGNRFVIKEVRANLMLDWLAAHTGARIVFLIRHPCSVIGSRMRYKDPGFEGGAEDILCQPLLMHDFLEPFRSTIVAADTPLRRHAIIWCVENLVALSQIRSRDWLFCFYEDFVCDQGEAFRRVFESLGLEPTSSTERAKNRVVSNPSHDLSKPRPWYASLTEAEGKEVLRVCEEFGLTLYGRQTMPLCSPRDLASSTISRCHAAVSIGRENVLGTMAPATTMASSRCSPENARQ